MNNQLHFCSRCFGFCGIADGLTGISALRSLSCRGHTRRRRRQSRSVFPPQDPSGDGGGKSLHAGHLCQALPPASHAAAHDRARYRFALSLPLYSNKILSMNRDSSLCSVASRVSSAHFSLARYRCVCCSVSRSRALTRHALMDPRPEQRFPSLSRYG